MGQSHYEEVQSRGPAARPTRSPSRATQRLSRTNVHEVGVELPVTYNSTTLTLRWGPDMPYAGIQVSTIDHTVQVTSEWLRDLSDKLGVPGDGERAYQVLRAYLQTLRDRLNLGEATDLAAQLPLLLRGLYYEGFVPAQTPRKLDRDEFLAEVADLAVIDENDPFDAEKAVQAATAMLRDRVSEGQMQDVFSQLPGGLRELLEQSPGGRL